MKQDFPVFFKRYIELFPFLHTPRFVDLTYGLLEMFWDENQLGDVPQLDVPFIAMAAGLHDIGKSVLAPSLANPTGALTPVERAVFETHTMLGAVMLSSVGLPRFEDSRIYQYGWQICLSHHERWDGCGYPQKLKGDQIPPYVQVVSLADQYDRLRTPRPNRSAYPHKQAMERILAARGAFAPQMLACFAKVMTDDTVAIIYPEGTTQKYAH